jgi:hypothetical protein
MAGQMTSAIAKVFVGKDRDLPGGRVRDVAHG